MKFTPTAKETTLLKDMLDQECLCIKKYDDYATRAHSSVLSSLFTSMADTEREHQKNLQKMMGGTVVPAPESISNGNNDYTGKAKYKSVTDRDDDKFLLQDMLTTEKHASSLYDTSVFEFVSPVCRKVLNHIQSEEQQHGEQLFTYMKNNEMLPKA